MRLKGLTTVKRQHLETFLAIYLSALFWPPLASGGGEWALETLLPPAPRPLLLSSHGLPFSVRFLKL